MRGSNKAYARRTFCNHVCGSCLCNVQAASQIFTLRTNCFLSLHITYKLLPKSPLHVQTASQVFTLHKNCLQSPHLTYKLSPWFSNSSAPGSFTWQQELMIVQRRGPRKLQKARKINGLPILWPWSVSKSKKNTRFSNTLGLGCLKKQGKTMVFKLWECSDQVNNSRML